MRLGDEVQLNTHTQYIGLYMYIFILVYCCGSMILSQVEVIASSNRIDSLGLKQQQPSGARLPSSLAAYR